MNRATSPTGWAKNPDGTPGWTWSPITGCLNHDNGLCKGGGFPCYAYKLANTRLKLLYMANSNIAIVYAEGGEPYHKADKDIARIAPFYPRFWEERLSDLPIATGILEIDGYKLHKGIFVCDIGDLFGVGVPEEWTQKVLDRIKTSSIFHRFYLLTKQPQNLIKFSPFPDNAWVGVTVTTHEYFVEACRRLAQIKATVKYISFEPLLTAIAPENLLELYGIDWLIIGACTGTYCEMIDLHHRLHGRTPAIRVMRLENGLYSLQPRIECLREIVEAADRAGIKVFLKDNLQPLIKWPDAGAWAFESCSNKLRQEMPGG